MHIIYDQNTFKLDPSKAEKFISKNTKLGYFKIPGINDNYLIYQLIEQTRKNYDLDYVLIPVDIINNWRLLYAHIAISYCDIKKLNINDYSLKLCVERDFHILNLCSGILQISIIVMKNTDLMRHKSIDRMIDIFNGKESDIDKKLGLTKDIECAGFFMNENGKADAFVLKKEDKKIHRELQLKYCVGKYYDIYNNIST